MKQTVLAMGELKNDDAVQPFKDKKSLPVLERLKTEAEAGPFKAWLAMEGRERIGETITPEQAIDRALETDWQSVSATGLQTNGKGGVQKGGSIAGNTRKEAVFTHGSVLHFFRGGIPMRDDSGIVPFLYGEWRLK